MKKIGILTIQDNKNFGNRLQNYALYTVLKNNGNSIYNIKETKGNNIVKDNLKNFLKIILNHNKHYALKIVKFNNFNKKFFQYINYNPQFINDKLDYVIVGSDQVWNCNFDIFNEDVFLENIDANKTISYAASFGISSISEENKDRYVSGLNHISKLSVREIQGQKIISGLVNRQSKVVLDPTFLLTDKEWDKIIIKPKEYKDKRYILLYFLGIMDKEVSKKINEFAESNSCIIIDILNKDSQFYSSSPEEFLFLEKNAYLIITDSFHSCVFSIIFNVPFLVVEREDKNEKMNSRIDTLLEKFDLDNRRFRGTIKYNELLNYADVNNKIVKERKSSLKFLLSAIEDEDEYENIEENKR